MRSGLIFAFVLTLGIPALSLLLPAGGAAVDMYSQRTYAPGDLILRADRIWIALWDLDVPDVGDAASNCAKNAVSLKEGYTLALDGVYEKIIPATEGMEKGSVRIANFSLYRNGEIVKKASVTNGEFFYYNMTSDGREYPVIEFRVHTIYSADGIYCSGWLIRLMPFNQYSDGTGVIKLNLTDNPVHLPPSEEWNRTFKGMDAEAAMSIQETDDGGYLLVRSYIPEFPANNWSLPIMLNRTDECGIELWNRTISEPKAQVYSILRTSDGGFAAAGDVLKKTHITKEEWLVKIGPNGEEMWERMFGGRYDDTASLVQQTGDGGYFLLGIKGESGGAPWLIRTDPKGNEIWNRTFGRTDEAAYSFTVTPDGGFVLAGVSDPDTTWFKKSDQNGNELWNRTYKGIGGRSVVIRQTSDGGYAAAIADPSGSQIRLIKTDPEGHEQWKKTYGESSFDDFQVTQDGGFLLWQSAWPDSRLLKVDQDGNEQWRRNMNDFIVSYVEQTKEGDYLLAATKFSDDVILGYTIEKLDSRGNKLWEKIFGNELSGFLSAKKKTIVETDNGYVITGRSTTSYNIILKKFKNRDIPFAVFTYEPEYPGVNQAVTFDASVSNDPKGNITNYRWDFGDGNTTVTSGKKVTHSYDRIGEVTVRLTVMNNSGGVNSTWKNVFVQELMAPEETMNVTFENFSGAKYAKETSDRGFIIAGGNNSIYEGWLVKTDPDGKEEWNWTFKGIELKSVIQTQDGGFMAAGEYSMSDIRLIKIDKTGKEEWNRLFKRKGIAPYLVFGIVFGENGTVARTHDGGYVIAGINRSVDTDFKTLYEAWLFKTDPQGNEEWSRILRGNEIGQNILSSVSETSDEGYIVTGTWWNPYGGADPFVRLMKTDQKGNEKWAWTSIISKNDHAGPGLQTSDGGFVMMGMLRRGDHRLSNSDGSGRSCR